MASSTYTILVVDDSLTQLSLLQDALQDQGYVVETARNGMEAIARIYQVRPDLILSDVLMPELNGYHLCRLLKNDPYTARIPIILLTNLRERHDRFWGEKAGADRFIEKENDLTPIMEVVAEFLPPAGGIEDHHLPAPPPELTSGDIRSRVTALLDRLLYESTISNEILQLTGLANDVDQLAKKFLQFLSVICRYTVACLALSDGRDKLVLCTQAIGGVESGLVELARQQTLARSGLDRFQQIQIRNLSLQEGENSGRAEGGELHLLHCAPIQDQGERLATLTIFSTQKRPLTEGTRHALKVVADRFLIVARYLRKFKETEEVKGDFVSMLVHDLRSPLTSIRGFTDVLAEGNLGSITDEQAAALDNIQHGCDRLLQLIGDILDLSKLEAGKMKIHPAPLSIRAFTERTFACLSALFGEKNLRVHLDIPEDLPWVLADGKQLARVMTNLLTNAAKFTPSGGELTVRAHLPDECEPGKPARLQIDVSDTGPGIPPDQQQKLFTRYQQLPAARVFRKGTGLGLAICKEIVLLHEGEIWVESPIDDGGGSRFSFTLPLA